MEYISTGEGDGYSCGYGTGDGDVYGTGTGDGDGYGDVYGTGEGDGYGDVYGCGYGYGYGRGYGTDGRNYKRAILSTYPQPPNSRLAFWRSNANGEPCNGGSGEPAEIGQVTSIPGPLKLCRRALHSTLNPEKWKGERLWVVALAEPVEEEGDKLGSLQRTIIAEIVPNPWR